MANTVKKKTTTTKKATPKVTKKVKEDIEVIEDDKKNVTVKEEKKSKLILLASIISIISFIAFIVFKYLDKKDFLKDTNTLIILICLFIINIVFIIIGLKNNNKKINKFIMIVLMLITILNIYNILVLKNVIKFSNDNYVLNFYNKPITDVYEWNKKKKINVSEVYEYSDIIPIYNIISQDVAAFTPLDEVTDLNLIVSNGPNYELETVVPSFIGWEYDTVIDYLEKHFLNNVKIEFATSTNKANTVISQEGSGSRKRNDLIKLVFAMDELKETEIIDLSGYSLIKATGWLTQHGFKYEINYDNNDNVLKDYIISNSNVGDKLNPTDDVTIKLIVSKGKIIKAPAFKTMTQDEINAWIMENDMKVDYQEKYDEGAPLGDIISSSVNENEIIEAGSKITIVISKGKLEMPKITSIDDFKIWASENKISYQINSEFSDTVKSGDVIKASHNEGDAIKEDDTVVITVSKGKSVTVPSFIGMTKSSAQSKCNSLGISCSFKYGGYTDKSKDIVVNQSQKSGAKISTGANLVITLSNGIQPKVNVPSFIGMTKSEITTKCKSLGITCNFTYQSSYSSTPKDKCVSQSKTGTVNKGSTITITLSKGPAKTYNLTIYETDCTWGNAKATKDNLTRKLKSKYPNVKFNISCKKADSGIGYLHQSSQIKIGNNTVTEGKTYSIIISGEC